MKLQEVSDLERLIAVADELCETMKRIADMNKYYNNDIGIHLEHCQHSLLVTINDIKAIKEDITC